MNTLCQIEPGIKMGKLEQVFGRNARNRICEMGQHSMEGALAALESFYHGFNNRSIETVTRIWYNSDLVQLNNPVGGIVRELIPIVQVYDRIFNGHAKVCVRFTDIVYYATNDMVVFAGTEIGELSTDDEIIPLKFRTSRCFGFLEDEGRWFQLHHHGSIDDPDLLRKYQTTISKK